MPIKWNAVDVAEAMDKVEHQLGLAEAFLAEAELRAREATRIANLPQYLTQRLHRLVYTIERRQDMKGAIGSIRDSIPDAAVKADRERRKQGIQQNLSL